MCAFFGDLLLVGLVLYGILAEFYGDFIAVLWLCLMFFLLMVFWGSFMFFFRSYCVVGWFHGFHPTFRRLK